MQDIAELKLVKQKYNKIYFKKNVIFQAGLGTLVSYLVHCSVSSNNFTCFRDGQRFITLI